MTEEVPPRRYGEEEIARILARATEVGEKEPRSAALPAPDGLTLDEVASIASEAGIDPLAVRRAAALVPHETGPLARAFLGAPVRPTVRARFPGRLPPARYGEATDLVERAFGRRGATTEEDDLYAWREDHGPGRTEVEVRRRGADSEVVVRVDRQGWALLTGLGGAAGSVVAVQLVGGVLGVAASLGPGAAVLLPLALTAVGLRLVFPRLVGGLAGTAEDVALGIAALLEPAPPGTDPVEGPAPEARAQLRAGAGPDGAQRTVSGGAAAPEVSEGDESDGSTNR